MSDQSKPSSPLKFPKDTEVAADLLRRTEAMLNADGSARRLIENAQSHHGLLRRLAGPVADLHRAGVFEASDLLNRDIDSVQRLLSMVGARFVRPDADLIRRLAGIHDRSTLPALVRLAGVDRDYLQQAMLNMHAPWFDPDNLERSIGGFAGLHALGKLVATPDTFSEASTGALRSLLGDWREPIRWPEQIFDNFEVRARFYEDRGFDPSLTDFSPEAFDESLESSGLVLTESDLPQLAEDLDPTEVSDFDRTNDAHRYLLLLERRMRAFIATRMFAAFGEDWETSRLPGNGVLLKEWREKKAKRERVGGPRRPLIEYADLMDYPRIILHKGNWREVFKPIFQREEAVREAFQRLHPARLDTMHARPISQEDRLLLFAECLYLLRAIRPHLS